MKSIYKIVATGFGAGFSPIAPGTIGSIAACILLYFVTLFFPENYTFYIFHLILIILFTALGIFAVNKLENEWGHDSPRFTIDEIVGMWISVLFLPFTLQNIFIGFILFRFFDILKPFGIRSLEKVHGGWGVMLDDMLAGVYANIILRAILLAPLIF